jgi:hypothetical protein
MRYLKSYKMFENIEYTGLVSLDSYVDVVFEMLEEEHCFITLERMIISDGETEILQKEEYDITSSGFELTNKNDKVVDSKFIFGSEHPDLEDFATDVLNINYGPEPPKNIEKAHGLIRRIKSKLESIIDPECFVTVTHTRLNSVVTVGYPPGTMKATRV